MEDFEKFLNDEITEEQFLEKKESLSPEEKQKLEDRIKSEQSSTLQAIKALRKEKKRVEEKVEKKVEPTDVGTKFREEQVSKASARFQQEFGVEEKDMPKYLETFKKLDEGHVDSELIFANLRKVYAYENPDSLLDSHSKMKKFEENAEDFMAEQAAASGTGSSGSGDDKKKYHPDAHALVKKSKLSGQALTLEQAQRYLERGLNRTF